MKWGEFKIKDLFQKINTNNVSKNSLGDLPATTAVWSNNQIGRYISRENATILKGVFSATANGLGRAFYQPSEFTVLQDSYAFQFIDTRVKVEKIHPFIVAALNKVYAKYDWVNKSGWNKVKEELIQLPITETGDIDFGFMEDFVSELQASSLRELQNYLKVTGLADYSLTKDEKNAIEYLLNGKVQWQDFKVVDLFDVKNAKNILSRDIVENSGNTPYLSASRENNSVSSYVSYNEALLDKGNCIFIGGKTFVVTYQDKDFYSNDSHNLILSLKNESMKTKLNHLFMVSCIYKSLGHRYSWGDSISNKKIQKDFVTLPVINQQPDYGYMQTLISAIQKLVIADVVKYTDREMAAYEQVVK